MKTTINLLRFCLILLLFQYGFANTPERPLAASVQFIHASGDQALKTIDIYVNGKIFLDDFQYKSATPFIAMPANVPLKIDILDSKSTSSAMSMYSVTLNLTSEQAYVIVANGMVSRTANTPFRPFGLNIFTNAPTVSTNNSIKMVFFNAATDAPSLGITETSLPIGVLAKDIAYGEFSNYMTLRPGDYQLSVFNSSNLAPRPGPDVNPTLAAFALPLQSLRLQGKVVTLIAMGLLNQDNNVSRDNFALYLALPTGGTLFPLAQVALSVQNFAASGIIMYPNPASSYMNIGIPFAYNKASARIIDMSGREVRRMGIVDRQINIADLNSGMYFLNLEIDNQVYMQKFYVKSQK